MKSTVSSTQAGRSMETFAHEVDLHRATLYALPEELQPESVKIGRRRIIIESPEAWLKRMQARGGIETVKPAAG
jgi:hypothetical protein